MTAEPRRRSNDRAGPPPHKDTNSVAALARRGKHYYELQPAEAQVRSTLTFKALGRNHIASTPAWAIAMLCFN
ncbi:Hypothetical predicted protein [Cloeon dipterum]|uniref:Uncharacterized protein n=1 Tax=Cloeon dipterum TaxID=197152 RepID=A0A8S1E3A8_9INSE|nr:Hypothetical predicted protein [Cloeon dipterum]